MSVCETRKYRCGHNCPCWERHHLTWWVCVEGGAVKIVLVGRSVCETRKEVRSKLPLLEGVETSLTWWVCVRPRRRLRSELPLLEGAETSLTPDECVWDQVGGAVRIALVGRSWDITILMSVRETQKDVAVRIALVGRCGAFGSSLANLQQRVAIIGSPPLLDVTWRTQGTQNSREQQRLGRASFSWCLLSSAVKNPQIHNNHGCMTTINWFGRTCNESKITLYYWLHTGCGW